MTSMLVPTTRRALLLAITTIVALVMSPVLAGCGTTPSPGATGGAAPKSRPTPSAASDGAAPGTLIVIIRHGEKPDGSSPGIDAKGERDDSSLTEVGWARAGPGRTAWSTSSTPPRLIRLVVSLSSTVAVVVLVTLAMLGLSAPAGRTAGPRVVSRRAPFSPIAGTVVAGSALAAASLIVISGLWVIVAG
jgi:hypothetical protein